MTILMYNNIDLKSSTMSWVSVDQFYRQMLELRSKQVVYLDDYNRQNSNHIVITFDRAYKNIFQYAAPILQEFNYPFELFLSSNNIGIETAEPLKQFIGLQELKELVNMKGRLQWHTKSQLDLTVENEDLDLLWELDIPEDMRALDPHGFKWFAYPYGRFNQKVMEAVKHRFSGGLSCFQGNDWDIYCLNRLTVTNSSSLSQAKVAVIIASYNYGTFLVEAIESVLRQTRLPDEILISDDASTDNTYEIALFYQKKYPNLIRVNKNEKNLGIVEHFNKAIGMISSNYIAILGADNRYRSDFIEKTAEILDIYKDVGIAYTDFALFGQRARQVYDAFSEDKKGKVKADKFFVINFPDFNEESRRELLEVGNFIHGSSMFRYEAFKQVGGYIKVPNLPEDYELFRRMVKAGWQARRSPLPLLEYRQHSRYQTNIQLNSYGELQFYKNLSQEIKSELERSQSQLAQTHTELERSQSQLAQTHMELERSQSQLAQTHMELERSQSQLAQNQSKIQLTQTELERAQYQTQQMELEVKRLQSKLETTQIHLELANNRIIAMESSKFWKLRQIWFRFKHLICLVRNNEINV